MKRAQDGSGYGVYARRFSAAGMPLTAEIQLNSTTFGDQRIRGVATRDNGDFVVAWASNNQDGAGAGAYARVFNASGAPLTSEIQVNVHTTGNQSTAAVAMESDGDFVVAWSSFGQDAPGSFGTYARRFSAAGTPLTGEIAINAHTTGTQLAGGVATADDGSFVVSWQGVGQADDYGIYARRFNASGAPLTGDIAVNSYTTGTQSLGRVALDGDGDFVVSWHGVGQADSYGIYARRFKSDGTALSPEFQVNQYTSDRQFSPGIAMNADGDFVVAWQSQGQDSGTYGIYARRFGSPSSADLSLTQTDSADPAQINSSLTYSLTVSNAAGGGAASGIQLTDTLPAGVAYASFSGDTEWNCAHVSGVVTCGYSGSLAAGASQTVDLTVTAPATIGKIINQATVSASTTDPDSSNNSATEKTQVCDPMAVDTVGFLSSSSSKAENAGSVLMSVNRSGGACGEAVVSYSTTDQSAVAGSDYSSTNGFLHWVTGEQGKKTYSIPLINDNVAEADEKFQASLKVALNAPQRSNGQIGGVTLGTSQHVVTIKNDDTAPTISLSSADQQLGESRGVATITATLSAARGSALTVPLVFSGTARRDVDYSVSGALVIPAGELSGNITVTPIDDALDENDETISIALGSVSGATPTGTTSNLVTLLDDDATPTVSFATASNNQPENKPKAGRLVLSTASGRDVTVQLSVSGGTADGSDYVLASPVTIPAGKLEGFALAIVDDAVAEANETVSISITDATGATPGSLTSHTHTIRNDDTREVK